MVPYMNLDWESLRDKIDSRMKSFLLPELLIQDYLNKVKKVYNGERGFVNFQNLKELSSEDIIDLEKLPFQIDYKSEITKEIVKKIAIIKLNGGLGTSMGLNKAKTLLKIKENYTFLDIILKQIRFLRKQTEVDVPLIFMNSYNTSYDTLNYSDVKFINHQNGFPVEFIQNRVPRIRQDNLEPFGDGNSPKDWCPPGHGDIFLSLKISGILDLLLQKGIEYIFISNGDNLGAIFEPSIMAYLIDQKLDFISEVTLKTPADVKGGILYRDKINNRIKLLETAQVAPENKKDFEDTTRFKDFNINNIWVNLNSLKNTLDRNELDLSLIVNPKWVDNIPVFQLETAMGSAIGSFIKTKVIRVPRNRFAPVKKCNDLLVKKSDVFILDEKFALIPSKELKAEPIVSLSSEYDDIQKFEELFINIPSLKECSEIKIKGQFQFDIPVKIRNNVTLNNPSNEIIKISDYLKSKQDPNLISISRS